MRVTEAERAASTSGLTATVGTDCIQTFLKNRVKLNVDWAFVDI